MKGISGWDYKPYTRLTETHKADLPYICLIEPGVNGFRFEWFDRGFAGDHTVSYRKYKSLKEETVLKVKDPRVSIEGLEEEQDYEFTLRRVGAGGQSETRVVRTGFVPGKVVNYLHPMDDQYAFSGKALCSPCIVRLPSGRLLASMDVFAGGAPQNLSLIFRSDDRGASWHYLTDLMPCFWGKMFVHRGVLYMLAMSTEYGDLLIGCSKDEGKSWSAPVRILPGGGLMEDGMHKAPMPVVEHNGRLYTAVDYGSWKRRGGHANGLLSIAVDDDLLVPENWCVTPFTAYDPGWPGASLGPTGGCIEGNAVVSPEGRICNYLRYNIAGANPSHGRAVILQGDNQNPEAALELDRIVDFEGGSNSKFTLRRDERTGRYYAIVNEVVDERTPGQRNVLSLAVSDDFYHWRIAKRLLDYRDASPKDVGFQYVDWIFDGEDILYLSRTAFNRARNFHDANYITFHVIEDFRKY